MLLKTVTVMVFLTIFGLVSTAHLTPPQTQQELLKDLSEFLRENDDVAKALRDVDMDHFMTRNRRDAIDDSMMDVESLGKDPQQKEEGFFDRAAKFMMEVLQRFLKWINSDN